MFHKGFFFFRFLGFLLLVALLIGGGSMLFQAGQAQGYAMGLSNAGKDLPVPAPGPAPYFYGHGWMMPHFSPFGPLLGLFFFLCLPFLLVVFLVGGIFRRMAWGRGPWGGGPHHGYPPGWGTPPWAAGQQPPAAPPQGPPAPGSPSGEPK